MVDFHGIIFAYSASPALGDLVRRRTAASLPFCGRYRLIDFALSSLKNAGIRDVGVIMQRDYQSLLDHIGSGKAWDMSRKSGGLRMLPPFGLPDYHKGQYAGAIEALNAVSSYIRDIPQKYVVLMHGNVCANIDLSSAIEEHLASGAKITAVCTERSHPWAHHKYTTDGCGNILRVLCYAEPEAEGISSLGVYILEKETLLDMMDSCRTRNGHYLHADAFSAFLADGGAMHAYMHPGYVKIIRTVNDYYSANMDMLAGANRASVFPAERPVRTRAHEEVSTYYGDQSSSVNSLVGDNCIIEGSIENCIVFPGCRIAQGTTLKNCIIMKGTRIGQCSDLENVIADKYVEISHGLTLKGSPSLPIVIPKRAKV